MERDRIGILKFSGRELQHGLLTNWAAESTKTAKITQELVLKSNYGGVAIDEGIKICFDKSSALGCVYFKLQTVIRITRATDEGYEP